MLILPEKSIYLALRRSAVFGRLAAEGVMLQPNQTTKLVPCSPGCVLLALTCSKWFAKHADI